MPQAQTGGLIVAGVVTLLTVLVIADRVAVGYAQDRVARRIAGRGFAGRPEVTITGFPFLTQLVSRRLTKVMVSAAGKRLGPVEVKRLDVTLYRMRVDAGNHTSTAARLSGTALIGFAGLAGVAGMPGLAVAADGPDQVKITADLGLVTGTATARVTRAGPAGIRIAVISAGGVPVAALGSLRDITLPLPALPPGVTIEGVSVSGMGVLVDIAGQDVSFGG